MGAMLTMEKKLVDLYFANLDLIEEGLPAAINRHRGDAIQAFNLNGLPTKKDERYKYTDLRSRYEGDFEHFFTPFGKGVEEPELIKNAYRIPLLNGYYAEEAVLTKLENGIIFGSLKAAANQYPEIVEKYYNSIADNESDGTVALNTAFMQDGAFIYIPRHAVADRPFWVSHDLGAAESAAVYLRNLLICEGDAEAKVVFTSKAPEEPSFLINSLSEIIVESAARLEVVEVQQEGVRNTHVAHTFVRQRQESRFQSTTLTLDGGVIRNNISVYLEGRGGENHTYGLFLCGEGESTDNSTNLEHRVPDCISYEDFRGVASSDGKGIFNGRILVSLDAQRTQAFQQNHNLLLSNRASIYTKPQLEIYADDVKCSHGATIGQLDPQAIFYMRQRGIGEEDAQKMQMHGFIRTILDKITIPELVEALDRFVTEKIDRL